LSIVYPIGTEEDPSGLMTKVLMEEEPTRLLVDCRLNPWSWRPIWQKPTLVQLYGARYHAAGRFLGNLRHPSNPMYSGKGAVELASPEIGIRGLLHYLAAGHDLVLLDGYLRFEESHIGEIVSRLTSQYPALEVRFKERQEGSVPGELPVGAPVYVRIRGENVAALVLGPAPTGVGEAYWVRLAARAPLLENQWLISDYPDPVGRGRLTRRFTHIKELDGP